MISYVKIVSLYVYMQKRENFIEYKQTSFRSKVNIHRLQLMSGGGINNCPIERDYLHSSGACCALENASWGTMILCDKIHVTTPTEQHAKRGNWYIGKPSSHFLRSQSCDSVDFQCQEIMGKESASAESTIWFVKHEEQPRVDVYINNS